MGNRVYGFRLSTKTRDRIAEAAFLSKLRKRPGSMDRVLGAMTAVCNAKARLRLRAAGVDVDGKLAEWRAGLSGAVRAPFRGLPDRPEPRVY